jgi:hypothetical protein
MLFIGDGGRDRRRSVQFGKRLMYRIFRFNLTFWLSIIEYEVKQF